MKSFVVTIFSDNELCVRVHGTRPENILFLIHESIETLINDVYEGISYDYLVPCPDCLLKTVSDFISLTKNNLYLTVFIKIF